MEEKSLIFGKLGRRWYEGGKFYRKNHIISLIVVIVKIFKYHTAFVATMRMVQSAYHLRKREIESLSKELQEYFLASLRRQLRSWKLKSLRENGNALVLDFSDTTYWYGLPEQVEAFKSKTDDVHKSIDHIQTFFKIKKIFSEISRGSLSLVDWGCFDARKSIALYQFLEQEGIKIENFHVLDNRFALEYALKNCEMAGVTARPRVRDFRTLDTIFKRDNHYHFHTFMGNTIRNFPRGKHTEETITLDEVVQCFYKQVHVGEFLLLEHALHPERHYEAGRGFMKQCLKVLHEGFGYYPSKKYFVEEAGGEYQLGFRLTERFPLTEKYIGAPFDLPAGTKLILGRVQRCSTEELYEAFEKAGFILTESYSPDNRYFYALFKKTNK